MKIGLMTSGGDCPGMNAAIRSVIVKAKKYGFDVVGIKRGWMGLYNDQLSEINLDEVSNILHLGGTILGTSRFDPFKQPDGTKKILDNIEKNKINVIIVIGGRDSFEVAVKVARLGINIIAIPKAINNDIAHTDYCIGFDSARAIVCDCIDKLCTTAFSHHRVMIVECMGRDAGWIALMGGLAGGANAILIPEVKTDIELLCKQLHNRRASGKMFSVIIISEGVVLPNMSKNILESKDKSGRMRYDRRNTGEALARYIEEYTDFEARVTVLGHLQRGGTPTAYDRIIATYMGIGAINAIKDRIFNIMVAYQSNDIYYIDLEDVLLNSPKLVDLALYEEAKLLYDI
jgi:6-phosphofructokinase 1